MFRSIWNVTNSRPYGHKYVVQNKTPKAEAKGGGVTLANAFFNSRSYVTHELCKCSFDRSHSDDRTTETRHHELRLCPS